MDPTTHTSRPSGNGSTSYERITKLERQVERLLGAVADIQQQLKDMTPAPYAPEAMEYIQPVAHDYGLEPWQVMSKSRQAHIVACRRKVWLHMHQDGWSYAKIAAAFKTDHGTVSLGVSKAQ
jgi:chromosomal replication initiation ATPase DnaA